MSPLSPAPSSPPATWTPGESRTLLPTRIFDVTARTFTHPLRGTRKEFFVIDAPDWGIALPVTAAGELVLVQQYRFGIAQLSWELPGGVIEPGEGPTAAVVRELAEETGYAGHAARVLGVVHPNPAIFANRCHIILIEDVAPRSQVAWDADEELVLVRRPIDTVLAEARAGRITHALMLNALFLLEPWWREHAPARAARTPIRTGV
jgi:8-oxo-dGTP pyrophosphatase MutT (NUDIX family)